MITSPAQFQLMHKVTQSLAGRIGILNLFSFGYSETPENFRKANIYIGSYPELIVRDYNGCEQWYSSYLETYVQKNVRASANICEIRDFRKLIQLLATRTSQILKREKHNATNADLYYYRTNHGVEADMIIDRINSKKVIEIKNSSTFRAKMRDGIEFLSDKLKQIGYLIYTGEELKISSKLSAVNFDSFLKN